MADNLTAEELDELCRTLADPANDCMMCATSLPGAFVCLPGGDSNHPFVQCCGDCNRFDRTRETLGDEAGAQAIAERLGLNVRRRYDDGTLRYWHVFLARPGSPDDRDTYCVGGNEFGCHPAEEVPLPDNQRELRADAPNSQENP